MARVEKIDWVEWLESVIMASAFVDGQMGRAHKKVDYFTAPEDRPNHNSKRRFARQQDYTKKKSP